MEESMKPERKLEAELVAAFKERGWFAHHFDVIGIDGWPDILALRGASYRLIECKTGTRMRKEQKAFHQGMADRFGVPIYIVEYDGKAYTLAVYDRMIAVYDSIAPLMAKLTDIPWLP
jgi:hypothetical protein